MLFRFGLILFLGADDLAQLVGEITVTSDGERLTVGDQLVLYLDENDKMAIDELSGGD